MQKTTSSFIEVGRSVIDIEMKAIKNLTHCINDDFSKACQLILDCKGRVVVTGMGKSGHIGKKIAATLASTGTPSFFVHPGEASHGDMGMITKSDIVLALSNSGETKEILMILPLLKRSDIPLISLTGNKLSALSSNATINLDIAVEQEACKLGLAPTASTTASLAMGDALAIALLNARGFTKEDFAYSHPGGSLGKRLLMSVDDLMHRDDEVPSVSEQASLQEALIEMTRTRLGATAIVSHQNVVLGIFTDGDLRRAFNDNIALSTPIIEVMTQPGKTVAPGMLAAEALRIMETSKINALLVATPDRKLIGALNMHDLLRAGVV